MRTTRIMFFLLLFPCVAMATTSAAHTDSSGRLTCYTCKEVTTNYQCNRFAVDRPCPDDSTFCQTIHVMDANDDTVSVMKNCADRLRCNLDTVGCRDMDAEGRQMCISCCDEQLCNESVPTNQSTAVFYSVRSTGGRPDVKLTLLTAVAVAAMIALTTCVY